MKYKLVALDLDGTLLRNDHSISPFTSKILKKLNRLDIKIVISTGRSYSSLKPVIHKLDLEHPVICYNGGMIRDGRTDEILHETFVPSDITKELIKIARREDLHFQGYLNGDFIHEQDRPEATRYGIATGLTGIIRPFDLTKEINFTKVMYISDDISHLKRVETELNNTFCDNIYVSFSNPRYLEIMDKGVNKGSALKSLMEGYGFKQDEVIAFGDGLNDREMLEFAGLGVVMTNGESSLKETFPNTQFTNQEDGVAKYLEELLNKGY